MESDGSQGWHACDVDVDGFDERSDDASIPASDNTENAVRRPEWWMLVSSEVRSAVRTKERLIAENPRCRNEVTDSRVIWNAVNNRLEAAVHTSLLTGRIGARKSAMCWLPVEAPRSQYIEAPIQISSDCSSDLSGYSSGPDPKDPDPGPSSRISDWNPPILESNDTDSDEPNAQRPVHHRDISLRYYLNHRSKSHMSLKFDELEPAFRERDNKPSKSKTKSRSKQPVITDTNESYAHSHQQGSTLPSTPEFHTNFKYTRKNNNDNDSEMFGSPLPPLESTSTYLDHSTKRDEQGVSRDAKYSATEINCGKKHRLNDQSDPSESRVSKAARKTLYTTRYDSSDTSDDPQHKPNHTESSPQRLSDSDASEFEISVGSRGLPRTNLTYAYTPECIDGKLGKLGNRAKLGHQGKRGNYGIRSKQPFQASESSDESPETQAAREMAREAKLLKKKMRNAKKDGALQTAAYNAAQPPGKIHGLREDLRNEGLLNIARRDGVHATYDKTKEFYRHDKHIRTINSTNKPAPAPVHPEQDDWERMQPDCLGSESTQSPAHEEPMWQSSLQQHRSERSFSWSHQSDNQQHGNRPHSSWNHQHLPLSTRPPPRSHSTFLSTPPSPLGPAIGSRRTWSNSRSKRSHNPPIRKQQRNHSDITHHRAEAFAPSRREQNILHREESSEHSPELLPCPNRGSIDLEEGRKQVQAQVNAECAWWVELATEVSKESVNTK